MAAVEFGQRIQGDDEWMETMLKRVLKYLIFGLVRQFTDTL
jgi:hypothetical protein